MYFCQRTALSLFLLISTSSSRVDIRANAMKVVGTATPSPNRTTIESNNLPKITLLDSDSSSGYGGIPGYEKASGSSSSSLSSLLYQNESIYIVPSTRASLTFQCEAKYPIFWNLVQSNVHPSVYSSLRVLSIRKFEDPFDPSTFTYVTILTMSGPSSKLTGNYSCQSTARNNIQSSVYIFWESQFGNAFVHSKENITVSPKRNGNGAEVVTLPCQVTDPDAKPKLTKETGHIPQPYEDIPESDTVHYSPRVGYTLENFANPMGIYKCELDENDFVSIRVVQKNESSSSTGDEGDTPEKRYTFEFDESSRQVKCCSTASTGRRKPPKTYTILCEHPSTCALREYHAAEWGRHMWNQGRRRGSCSVLNIRNYHSGVIRCVGKGFSVYKEFISPLGAEALGWNPRGGNITTYFRWEEIDPQEMIKITSNLENVYWDRTGRNLDPSQDTKTIYAEESIHLSCQTSRYYFAEGTYWMVRWKNQTMTPLDSRVYVNRLRGMERVDAMYYDPHRHINEVSFAATSGMESVICLAPVWNSSLWVSKIHYLWVNETMAPSIGDSKEIVKYTWYTNETNKELTCTGRGIPAPTFTWEKDNVTILTSTHNYDMIHTNGSTKDETSSGGASGATSETDLGGGGGDETGDDDNTSTDATSDDELNQNNGNYSEIRNETGSDTGLTASSALRISRVSYSTQGIFRCVATNFGGSVFKEFRVTVIETKPWGATGVLVGGSVITLFLIIGIIFLLRKLHLDRQEINQLTGGTTVNFGRPSTDATRTSSSSNNSAPVLSSPTGGVIDSAAGRNMGFNSMSLSFDNGGMTNPLIDNI